MSAPESAVDAGVDATIDAPLDVAVEASVPPVVVTVVGAGGPEPGVTIVYDDATGAVVLGTATTDANGQAARVLPPGSMVTALIGDPSTYAAPFTVMGVEPGDALTMVDWGSFPTPGVDSRVGCSNVDIATLPPFEAGSPSFYVASAGHCASNTSAPPLGFSLGGQGCATYQVYATGPSGCISTGPGAAPTFPLLVEAYDSNDNPLGFLVHNGNALPPVGAADAGDAGTDELTLTGPWQTAMTSQTVSIINQPDGGNVSYTPTLSEAVGGTLMTAPQLIVGPGVPFTTHPGYADFVQVEATYAVYFQSALAMANAIAPPTADGTITMDVSPMANMPVLSGATFDNSAPPRPVISWTTSQGSLSTVTGIIAFASWSYGGSDGGAPTGTWTIVSPPTTSTSVQAPAMPPSLNGWGPAPGTTGTDNIVVWGLQGSALPNYAAVRAAASAFPEVPACNITAPVIPALATPGTSLMITLWSSAFCG